MKLTKRQREIYDYIRGFLETNGYAPSLEEIGAHFGLASVATVHEHLSNLEAKGALRRDAHRSRALEITRPRAAAIELLARPHPQPLVDVAIFRCRRRHGRDSPAGKQ